jgi:hypothetical protein
MSELIKGNLNKEASYDLEFVDGKFKLSFAYDGQGIDGQVAVMVEVGFFLDKLAAVIPGEIDDALLGALKKAFT